MLWPAIKLRSWGLLAAGAVVVLPAVAQQIPGPRTPPMVVQGWPDAAVFAAGLTALAAPRLLASDSVRSPCPCRLDRLPGFDAAAVGSIDSRAAAISDAGLVGTAGGALLALALSRPGAPGQQRGEDLSVLAQSVVLAAGLTQIVKVFASRPRPFLYETQPSGEVPRDDVESFPSGHSSVSFAAAAGYWSVLQRRGVAGRHTFEIVALFGAATATGALRVRARKHFPTDVVAGAVLGALVGWAAPAIR